MRVPSGNPITLPFGATSAPYTSANPHKGTDFSYQPDNKIYAPFSGKVTQIPNNGNDGNGSYMTEPNGRFHGMLHASQYLVPNGSNVSEGQAIAVMGETGYAFGVHLHWAVKENGVFIDPMSLISKGVNEMTKDQATELARYIRLLEGESVDEANGHSADDVAHILADPGYAAALAKQIYSGDRFQKFSYKASHYDTDVKAGSGDAQAKLDQIKKIVG